MRNEAQLAAWCMLDVSLAAEGTAVVDEKRSRPLTQWQDVHLTILADMERI